MGKTLDSESEGMDFNLNLLSSCFALEGKKKLHNFILTVGTIAAQTPPRVHYLQTQDSVCVCVCVCVRCCHVLSAAAAVCPHSSSSLSLLQSILFFPLSSSRELFFFLLCVNATPTPLSDL